MPKGDPAGYLPRVKQKRKRLGAPVYQPGRNVLAKTNGPKPKMQKSVRKLGDAVFGAGSDITAAREHMLKGRLKRKRNKYASR